MEAVSSYVQLLFDRFQASGLLVDANLLLLDLVGSYDPRLVGDGRFNKLSKYTIEDYALLTRLKSVFRRVVTTPHVLTEVSNLTGDLPETVRMSCFGNFIDIFDGVEEIPLQSFEVARRAEFRYLGLTDCGLAELSQRFLIVSDDGRMITALNRSNLDALNFNHLREHLFH